MRSCSATRSAQANSSPAAQRSTSAPSRLAGSPQLSARAGFSPRSSATSAPSTLALPYGSRRSLRDESPRLTLLLPHLDPDGDEKSRDHGSQGAAQPRGASGLHCRLPAETLG